MKLSNLKITFDNLANGGHAILQEIAADHPYRDGKSVLEEITGRKVTVVFPANHYDTLTVKVSDPTDALSVLLENSTPDNPVYVEFDDFSASVYAMRGNDGQFRTGISAKASHVRAVERHQIGGMDDIVI